MEHLHRIDLGHGDLHSGNIAFGTQPEPANGSDRLEDVMYDADVFLFGN